MKASIRAHSAPWRRAVEFYMTSTDGKSRAQSVIMEPVENDGIAHEPSFQLSTDDAQTLMDDLWHAGLRPTEGSGSAGALKAVERRICARLFLRPSDV